MSIHDMIIDERGLFRGEDLVGETLAVRKEYNTETLGPGAKSALGKHLLFSSADLRERAGVGWLSDAQAFYNSYYWFLIFAKLCHGIAAGDAGLEQQSFKLLEQAPSDCDWKVLEEIASTIGQS